MTDTNSIEEAIQVFLSEFNTPHEELDWWLYDDGERVCFNIHNHGKDDVDMFDVDVYPYLEGYDKPSYTVWNTMKTFNFNEYKKRK